jgi:hypothetical protein
MTALQLDLNGNNATEKISTETHSDDDADSDFDDGGSQKRRPRVRRAEDIDDEHHEEPVEAPKKNAWEMSPPKEPEVDPWADPAEPGKASNAGKAGNTTEKDSNTRPGNNSRGSDSRGRGGGRGRGDRGRDFPDRGRGGIERGRGRGERGRGNGERGRGAGERGRGGDRARGEKGRGRGGGRGAAPTSTELASSENTGVVASSGDTTHVPEDKKAVSPAPGGGKPKEERPKRQESKGKRPEKAPEEPKESTTTNEGWELPTDQDGGWGAGVPDSGWGIDTQQANAPAKSPTSARSPGGWGNASPTEGTDSNKPFKRVPIYVNTERVKTGGSERVSFAKSYSTTTDSPS